LEELREVWFNRSSTRATCSNSTFTNPRTESGVATQSSGLIPVGGVRSSLDIAFLYHSPSLLTNFPIPI
jgi:hypothetical protein